MKKSQHGYIAKPTDQEEESDEMDRDIVLLLIELSVYKSIVLQELLQQVPIETFGKSDCEQEIDIIIQTEKIREENGGRLPIVKVCCHITFDNSSTATSFENSKLCNSTK